MIHMEHQNVAMVYIPGAFIQAGMECETMHMNLEGKIVELLTKARSKAILEICDERKRNNGPLCGAKNPYMARSRQRYCSGET